MATTPAGILTSDSATDIVEQKQRMLDMSNVVAQLEPDNSPFVTLMGRLGTGTLKSPKREWLEVVSMPRFDTVTASATSAAASLAIASANSAYYRVGDGIRITETGEFVEVTSVSSTAIGVSRGYGGTTAASCTSAAGLYIVNNANAEGATLRSIRSVKLSAQYNYAQILRTPGGATETTIWSDFYGQWDTEYDRLQYEALKHHEQQKEATLFWGARREDLSVTTSAGAPKRWSGGLFEFIATNVGAAVTTLTRAAWETFLRSGFRYGSEEKWFFCSPLVMSALDGFVWNTAASSNGNAQRQIVPTGKNGIGIAVTRYECSQGTVNIVKKKHWNDSADLRGSGFLVDMNNVKLMTAPARNSRVKEDVQANDADKREFDILSEFTLEVRQEATHAYMKGVTG